MQQQEMQFAKCVLYASYNVRKVYVQPDPFDISAEIESMQRLRWSIAVKLMWQAITTVVSSRLLYSSSSFSIRRMCVCGWQILHSCKHCIFVGELRGCGFLCQSGHNLAFGAKSQNLKIVKVSLGVLYENLMKSTR